MNKKYSKYLKALEDWCPSFPDGKVLVSWHQKENRISIWGDDDFGMEKFSATKKEYDNLDKQQPISIKYLKENGFVNA